MELILEGRYISYNVIEFIGNVSYVTDIVQLRGKYILAVESLSNIIVHLRAQNTQCLHSIWLGSKWLSKHNIKIPIWFSTLS